MPAGGVKPKDGPIRHRNRTHEFTLVPRVRYEPGHPMPALPKGFGYWHLGAKHWWDVVSHMPHCILWEEPDWIYAQDTLCVVNAFYHGDMSQSNALRMREAVLGLTLDARRDLRIKYVDPEDMEETPEILMPSVTAIAEYERMVG